MRSSIRLSASRLKPKEALRTTAKAPQNKHQGRVRGTVEAGTQGREVFRQIGPAAIVTWETPAQRQNAAAEAVFRK